MKPKQLTISLNSKRYQSLLPTIHTDKFVLFSFLPRKAQHNSLADLVQIMEYIQSTSLNTTRTHGCGKIGQDRYYKREIYPE